MIEINLKLERAESGGGYLLRLGRSPELLDLVARHKGEVGVRIAAPMSAHTDAQMRAVHALLAAYFTTGMHSCPEGYGLDGFKLWAKMRYGPCIEIEYEGKPVRLPKSMSRYTKKELTDFMESLISEITQSGAVAESEKLQEILRGMEENRA